MAGKIYSKPIVFTLMVTAAVLAGVVWAQWKRGSVVMATI